MTTSAVVGVLTRIGTCCLRQSAAGPADATRGALLMLQEGLQQHVGSMTGLAEHCGRLLATLRLSDEDADALGEAWLNATARCFTDGSAASELSARFLGLTIEHALSQRRVLPMPNRQPVLSSG